MYQPLDSRSNIACNMGLARIQSAQYTDVLKFNSSTVYRQIVTSDLNLGLDLDLPLL